MGAIGAVEKMRSLNSFGATGSTEGGSFNLTRRRKAGESEIRQ